jgi:thioredoxin-like negative regulator of GroEL
VAVVDVSAGKTVSSLDGLVPADRFSWWLLPVLPPAEAGLASATLFLDAGGHLVRFDPATGQPRQLLPKPR